MENQNDQARKAEGASRRQSRASLPSSPPKSAYQRPQPPSRRPSGFQPEARRTSLYEPEAVRRAAEFAKVSKQNQSNFETFEHQSDSIFRSGESPSNSSEEWEVLTRHDDDGFPPTEPSIPPPSYDFPGTWQAAMHDTSTALSSVSTATASYATAIQQSGLGKAGMSVGTALLSSTNKGALSIVSWAADRTGTGPDSLPRPVAGWLKSGREKMEEAEKARQRRARRRQGLSEEFFPNGRSVALLETMEMRVDEDSHLLGGETEGDWVDEEGLVEALREDGEEEEGEGERLVRLFEFDD